MRDVRSIASQWLNSTLFFWLLCAGIGIALYYPALATASFRRDDFDWIALVQNARPIKLLSTPLWGVIWRPVVAMHFYVLRILFHQPPLVFFVANLFAHIALGGLIYTAISQIYNRRVALFSAMIFITRPGIVDAVAWPSAVGVMYAGICGLGSVIYYDRFIRSRRLVWYTLAFLLGIIAILSKEETALLPFMLVLMAWLRYSRWSLTEFSFTLPFWFVTFVINGYRLRLAQGSSFWKPEIVYGQVIRLVRGIVRSVAPFDTWMPPFSAMIEPLRIGVLLLGLAAILLIFWLGYQSLQKCAVVRENLLFSMSCLVLTIAPVTLSGHEVAWRYEYLPMLVASFLYATLLRILDLSNRGVAMYLLAASVIVTNTAQLYLFRGTF